MVNYLFIFLFFSTVSFSVIAQQSEKEIKNRQFEKTKQLIVMINADADGNQEFGAGIIVGRGKDELLIATAYHFLHAGAVQANKIQVEIRSMPGKFLNASILKYSTEDKMDFALLSVKDLARQGMDVCSLSFDRLGDTSNVEPGDGVFPLGNPNGASWAMPVVADKIADVVAERISFQSSFITKGNSGGALLNDSAGITGLVIADQPPFGRAITIATVISKLKEWGFSTHLRKRDNKGQTPLHLAAAHGNLIEIKQLLSDCNNINQKDDHRATPLHFAAYSSTEALKALIKAGADLNSTDADGDPPLEWADEKRNAENVRILVTAGGKWKNFSPMIIAGIKGDLSALKKLLTNPENLKQRDDHQATPLHYFAAYATKEAITVLINAGADLKSLDEDKALPVEWSAQSGRIDNMELLLAAGSKDKTDMVGRLASAAVKRGKINVVQYLFEKNKSLQTENLNYRLTLAVRNKEIEMVKFLLNSDGSLEQGEASTELSPLIVAIETGQIEAIKLLIAHGADINSPGYNDNPGRSFYYPLNFVFQQNFEPEFMLKVLKALVSVPKNKSKSFIQGTWSLSILFKRGFKEDFVVDALKVIVPSLKDINEKLYNDGGLTGTLLYFALTYEYNNAAKLLRDYGIVK